MKLWKMLEIVHMFTRSQTIRPEGDKTKVNRRGVENNWHDFDCGRFQLFKARGRVARCP